MTGCFVDVNNTDLSIKNGKVKVSFGNSNSILVRSTKQQFNTKSLHGLFHLYDVHKFLATYHLDELWVK